MNKLLIAAGAVAAVGGIAFLLWKKEQKEQAELDRQMKEVDAAVDSAMKGIDDWINNIKINGFQYNDEFTARFRESTRASTEAYNQAMQEAGIKVTRETADVIDMTTRSAELLKARAEAINANAEMIKAADEIIAINAKTIEANNATLNSMESTIQSTRSMVETLEEATKSELEFAAELQKHIDALGSHEPISPVDLLNLKNI